MNPEQIKKTATCTWCDASDGFVVQSPLALNIVAVGDTKAEAWEHFEMYLADSYEAFLAGTFKPRKKAGRPAGTPGETLSLRMLNEDANYIKALAKANNLTYAKVLALILKFHRQHMGDTPLIQLENV